MKPENDSIEKIIRLLDEGTAALKPHITSKLAEARQQAVSALRTRTAAGLDANSNGTVRLFGDYIYNHRALMSAALLCSAVFAAFLLMQQFSGHQEVTEQGDAFLLASELPPDAYVDKGFNAWLEQTSQQ